MIWNKSFLRCSMTACEPYFEFLVSTPKQPQLFYTKIACEVICNFNIIIIYTLFWYQQQQVPFSVDALRFNAVFWSVWFHARMDTVMGCRIVSRTVFPVCVSQFHFSEADVFLLVINGMSSKLFWKSCFGTFYYPLRLACIYLKSIRMVSFRLTRGSARQRGDDDIFEELKIIIPKLSLSLADEVST